MSGLNQFVRYYENSSATLSDRNIELICRELRILTHAIEKGMTLPNIKKGFGKEKVKKILELMDEYISLNESDYDQEAFDYAFDIIEKYIEQAEINQCDISFINMEKYRPYKKSNLAVCGTMTFHSDKFLETVSEMNFEQIAKNRHSVRKFATQMLDEECLKKAVGLAQTAPSACNRQSTRVHYIKNKEICKELLDLQGGAKGHSISELLIVTSDLTLYRYTSEFKTPYLDSGIYLMNLLYSLTYYGIATCPLIWTDEDDKAQKIREHINIPMREQIIAIVQVGYYADEECCYAASKRRELSDIFREE